MSLSLTSHHQLKVQQAQELGWKIIQSSHGSKLITNQIKSNYSLCLYVFVQSPYWHVWALSIRMTCDPLVQPALTWVARVRWASVWMVVTLSKEGTQCGWVISNVKVDLLCSEMVIPVRHQWIALLLFQTNCLLLPRCLHSVFTCTCHTAVQ